MRYGPGRRLDGIVSIGFCGALDPTLAVGRYCGRHRSGGPWVLASLPAGIAARRIKRGELLSTGSRARPPPKRAELRQKRGRWRWKWRRRRWLNGPNAGTFRFMPSASSPTGRRKLSAGFQPASRPQDISITLNIFASFAPAAVGFPEVVPALLKLDRRCEPPLGLWGILLPTLDSELVPRRLQCGPRCIPVRGVIVVKQIPTPAIGPGELLMRVESCGICHTDLKKIEHNLLAPPRIFGHETAGVVVAAGSGCRGFSARATASLSSITSPAWSASIAGRSSTHSARSTRRSASPPGSSPPVADSPNTCA